MQLWERLAAIKTSKVEPSLRLVLVMLAEHMADDRLLCWQAVETIADETGYCERQTREILNELESRGLIRRRWGDHKCRDVSICWEALALARAPVEARGGKRAAKIAASPAKFAGESTGKDCHRDRQSLPVAPAKIATATGKDCPRTVPEPSHPPLQPPPAPAGPEDVVLPDGRVLPGDLPGLLQMATAGRIVLHDALMRAGIGSTQELLRLTEQDRRYTKNIGPPIWFAVEATLRRQGIELGCLAPSTRPRPIGGLPVPVRTPAALPWESAWDDIRAGRPIADPAVAFGIEVLGGADTVRQLLPGSREFDWARESFLSTCDEWRPA